MADNRDGEIIVGLDIKASTEVMEKDAKEALSQIKDLKVKVDHVELGDKAGSELQGQLDKLKNTSIKVSNIEVDQAKINKAGQQLGKSLGEQTGKSLGDSIDKSLASSLNSVHRSIENVVKSFSSQRLNSANLMRMFNIDASKVDTSVVQQIRSLTNEINTLGKEAVKSGSASGMDTIIDKIASLSQVIKQFGSGRDLEQFKESLDVLDYFQGKKIHVGEVSELLSNTGMGVRELNNQFRNLDVTFTTLEKDTVKLDTVWEELFQISPSLNQFDTFGEQINAVVEHLKIAKEALYGDSNLIPINENDVSDVLLKFVDNMDEAIAKVTLLREQESELRQSMAETGTSAGVEESVKELEKESSAMKDVEESADKAAQEKLEFADANRRVADSAEVTSRAVEQEHDAMQSLDDLGYILQNVNMQGQEGNSVFQQFGDTLREAFYAFTFANILQDSIYKVIDGGKEAVETVKELNDAATALRMATGDSYASVKQMMTEYNTMAQDLGAVTTSVSDAADAWLRQGKTVEETNTLIKDSMMLAKVAELDASDSTKYLTSAMQGYKVAVEDVEKIVDKLSSIDLESATDAGGLAEAMSRTAESAQIAGVSMDRLLAMLATTGEVTQKSMSSIGESYKTIFARMRDIKENKLSVVGDDGEVEDLSTVETVLNQLGIKLRDSNQEFRNFEEVLTSVGNSWDQFSSVQQAAIAKAFAGQRQAENFLVLMENYDKVLKYTNVAENSQGTAAEKFGYYIESLEAKTNSLKASLENLASTTISDELYGSVLDTTKAMVDMTAQSGILKGALAGLGTSGAIYAFQQLAGYLHNATQEFSNFGTALEMTRNGQVGIDDMQNLINLTGNLTQSQTRLLLSTENLTDAQKVAVLMNQRLAQGLPQITEAEAMQQLQTMGVATAEGVATGATITFTSALRGLWSTLKANPLVLVAAAVSAGVMAWNKHKQAIEDSRQAMLSAGEAEKDEAKNIIELYNAYAQADSAYKSNTGSKEQLEGATDSLLDALGVEQSEIETLIEKYGSLDKAIQNVTNDALQKKLSDLTNGYQAAKEDLKDSSKSEPVKEFFNPFHKSKNTVDTYITKDVKAFNILRKTGLDSDVKEGKFQFDVSSAEDAIAMYDKLIQMKEALEAETGKGKQYASIDELGKESELYGAIVDKINEMRDSYDTVNDYISDINQTAAQIEYNIYTTNNGVPETVEEFEQLRDSLVETAKSSGRFVGSQQQIEDSVVNALADIPELTSYIDEYNQSLSETQDDAALTGVTKSAETISNLNSQVTALTSSQESFTSALSEQNQTGTISNETLAKLSETYGVISDAVEMTSNGIILNTEKLAELNQEQRKAVESNFADAEEELTKRFNENSKELAYYNQLLEDGNGLVEINGQSLEDLIAQKQADQDATKEQIAKLQSLQLEYENVTSKHNAFIQSLSSKDAGSMYDDVVSGLDTVQKAWDNGDYGKDEIRNFVDYMSYADMSTASIEEIKSAYDEAMKSAKTYFTESIDGQQNFLNLLKETKVNGEALASVDENGNWTIDIENLDEAAKACGFSVDFLQDNLNKLKDKGFDINFKTDDGLVDIQANLDGINERIAEIKARINDGDGSPKLKEELEELEKSKVEITIELNKQKAIEEIQSLQAQMDTVNPGVQAQLKQKQAEIANQYDLDLQSVLSMDTTTANDEVDELTDKVENLDLSTTIKVDADTAKAKTGIDAVTNKTYTTKVALEVEGTSFKSKVKSIIENAVNRTGSTSSSSGAGAYGTANITGNANADGNIGTKKTQKNVMVSEIAPEMVVDPHSGQYTIYNHPTMLDKLPKDAIVFNGKQTEDILKNGMSTSFGKAYANGNMNGAAYPGGTGASGSGTLKGSSSSTTNNNKDKSKDKSSSSSSKSSSKTLIDWIERRINVLTTKTERWANIIENAINPKRLDSYYKKLEANYKAQVKTYSNGAARYLQKANSIKLSSDLKNKVKSKDSSIFNKDGSMKSYKKLIKEYGEKTAKKIQDYQDYIDKYESALDGFIEATQNLYQAPIEKASKKIELLSDSLELLDAKLDNISIDDYKKANENLKQQTKNAEEQLKANQEAAKTAKSNYNSTKSAVKKKSNLESNDLAGDKSTRAAAKKKIKKAVANGEEIDLTLYKEGSSGYKAAVKYNAALKAQKEAIDAAALSQEEYTKTLRENAKAQFDNIQTYYESKVKLLDHQVTTIDNRISEIETAGANVNKSYYQTQKKLNEDKKKQYTEEKAKLEEQLKTITQGTQEWYDAKDAIQECANSISECVKETYNLNNAINTLHFNLFNDVADSIERIITEQEFLQGLFAHENLTDKDSGIFTNAGLAKLGSYSASYYASMEKANKDATEVKELKRMLDSKTLHSDVLGLTFNSVDDLQDKLKEMYTQWQNDIKSTYSLESNIADLMKEKYQAELDLLKELIDAKKKALEAEKDLHDYQRSIQEKSKDITTIQKQIAAYRGDTSQEGLAKLQKLQVQLAEKEEDLRETEYERYISDQQDMLDKLSEEYEELITKKLEDFMGLVQEGLTLSNDNTTAISSYLSQIAGDNGYTEETKGLFTTVAGNIESSTRKIIDEISAVIKSLSGTEETKTSSATTVSNPDAVVVDGVSHGTGYKTLDSQTNINVPTESLVKKAEENNNAVEEARKTLLEKAIYYVQNHGSKTSKSKSKLSDVNKKFYEKYNKKELTTSQLKGLAKLVNVSWNGDSKSGNLYKKLKSIKFPGFKKGGVVDIEDIEKQVHANGDTGLVSVKNGEGIIPTEMMPQMQTLIDNIPMINDLTQSLVKTPDLTKVTPIKSMGNVVNIDNVTLPNVKNYEEFKQQMYHDMQRDHKFEGMIQDMTVNRIVGANGLTKYRHKF